MARLRAVLLDLHGTLVFTSRVLSRDEHVRLVASRTAPLVRGHGIGPDELTSLWRDLFGAVETACELAPPGYAGVDCPFIVQGAFADRGVTLTREETTHIWNASRLPLGDYAQLFPDTLDVLRSLRSAGLRLALVTNQPYPGDLLLPDLEAHHLLPWFDAVVVSHDLGYGKPHPAIFEQALERVGAAPREAVMIGDTPAIDVAGAKAAGMPAVLKRNGDRRRPAGDADHVIDDLIELLSLPLMPPAVRRADLAPSPTPHEDDNEGRY